MTKVIQKGDPFRANPIPRWVGIWVCKQCGSESDIGEDWEHSAVAYRVPGETKDAPWVPAMNVRCPVCRTTMHAPEFKRLYWSQERQKAKHRRRYPTVWSRMKARWFGWID